MSEIIMSAREKRNAERSYTAATQGMVLLKNTNNVLPIAKNRKIALFGLGAVRTVRGGTGSGDPFNGGLSGGGNSSIDQSPRYNIHILNAFESGGYEVLGSEALREYAAGYDKLKNVKRINPMETFVYPEMELNDGDLQEMAKSCDTAVYVLARNSGEGHDRKMMTQTTINDITHDVGDYLLCEREIENLRKVKKAFSKTILVLNVGGVVELAPAIDTGIDAVLLMGQAGQEGGRAVRDVLNGTVNPSGKLNCTWAKKYSDYPASATFADNDNNSDLEKYEEGIYVGYRYFDSFGIEPLFEFGFGKSYTSFEIAFNHADVTDSEITVNLSVKNTGNCTGREVVQIYYSSPESELEMPVQELAAFKKTADIKAGESQEMVITFSAASLASFDEKREAYILSAGDYGFYAGNSSRATEAIFIMHVSETTVTDRVRTEYPLNEVMTEISKKGKTPFMLKDLASCPVLKLTGIKERDSRSVYHDESVTTYTTDSSYKPVMPYEKVKLVEKRNIRLMDVINGKATMQELVAQMTAEQLAALNCGTGSGIADDKNPVVGGSSKSVPGAAGETTHILADEFGIPSMIVADGPAGIRITQEFEATNVDTGEKVTINHFCTAWPVGNLISQSFDTDVMELVGTGMAEELDEHGIAIILGPGMNIMRDPLCGRNFEYFSEDPLLSGILAAANTVGIQSIPGLGACIKHYVANNQETNRNRVDTWIHQRAFREIYLKGFEIAVRESQPMSIMTSYNLVNGVPTADSFDLCTDIARGEWGFKGLIMTDWNGGSSSPSKSMHAGNDLIMPGGALRAMNIMLAFNTIEPVFNTKGQVNMSNTPPFPIYFADWNSFALDPNGKDTITASISDEHKAEVKDGRILVDGEPIFTKANGFMELIRDRENFVPFIEPVTTENATLSADGKSITYKGTLNRTKSICLGDLQRCAVNNINVIAGSIAMRKLYPNHKLEVWK